MDSMKNALDRKLKVTGTAFERVKSRTGQQTNRPLEIYESLKPEDFAQIAGRYGIDETIRYIKTMEGLRMKGRK